MIKFKKKEKNNDQEFVFNNSYSEQVKDFSQIGNKLIQNSHEVWNMSVWTSKSCFLVTKHLFKVRSKVNIMPTDAGLYSVSLLWTRKGNTLKHQVGKSVTSIYESIFFKYNFQVSIKGFFLNVSAEFIDLQSIFGCDMKTALCCKVF